ncbi:MAG: LysM peptidoglycan-binding domain-containing protein, partial [Burkholderiales bacterium]
GRVILESGNRAFVSGMGDSKESTWFVYRRGGPLVDPETKMTMGYEAVYLGTASLVRPGDPAVIRVSTATREISIGDKLIPAGRPEIPNYAPRAPTVTVNGQVMSIYGGTNEAGGQSIITINRGKAQGIERGNVLALYRPGAAVMIAGKSITDASGRHVLPDERYGLVFVFRVFDHVSYGLVMSLSKSVRVQDLVQNP